MLIEILLEIDCDSTVGNIVTRKDPCNVPNQGSSFVAIATMVLGKDGLR